jgi:hypothetical protein
MYSTGCASLREREQEVVVLDKARAAYLQRREARAQAKMHILERLCGMDSSMAPRKQLPKQPFSPQNSKVKARHTTVNNTAGLLQAAHHSSPQHQQQARHALDQRASKPPLPPIPLMHRSSFEDAVSALQNRMPQVPVDSTPMTHNAQPQAHAHGQPGGYRSPGDAMSTSPPPPPPPPQQVLLFHNISYEENSQGSHGSQGPDTPIPLPAISPSVSSHTTNSRPWPR